MRWKIEACIQGVLDGSQAGFVRGKRIDENVSFFNDKFEFYSALYTRYSPHHPGPGIHSGQAYTTLGRTAQYGPKRTTQSQATQVTIVTIISFF